MRFGLFLTNQYRPDEPIARRFEEAIEQVRLARDLGFDLIMVAQHFLTGDFQMLQPNVAAARLAAEAGTMRVGTGVYLLPLLNPVALAEETASLDVVTGGRLIFGVGLGYREVEDRAFGMGKGERVRRFRAHLEVVRKLWAGEPADYDAAHCHLEGATTAIRPLQRPRPPIWIGADADRAVERAAELGDTWIINPHTTLATIQRQIGLYQAALDRQGKPFPEELPMLREVCVAPNRDEAVRLARPHLERKYQAYVAWGQDEALPGDESMAQAFDDLARDRFIIGGPAECAAEVQRCAEMTGANTLIFRAHWPGMPQEAVLQTIRLLGEQVRPRVGASRR